MPAPRSRPRSLVVPAQRALGAPLRDLNGVSREAAAVLKRALQIETVHDLAESSCFEFAAQIAEASSTPTHVYRRFGVPIDRVVKSWANKTAAEIAQGDLYGELREPLGSTQTNAQGFYSVQCQTEYRPNLEIWTVDLDDGEARLSETEFRVERLPDYSMGRTSQ